MQSAVPATTTNQGLQEALAALPPLAELNYETGIAIAPGYWLAAALVLLASAVFIVLLARTRYKTFVVRQAKRLSLEALDAIVAESATRDIQRYSAELSQLLRRYCQTLASRPSSFSSNMLSLSQVNFLAALNNYVEQTVFTQQQSELLELHYWNKKDARLTDQKLRDSLNTLAKQIERFIQLSSSLATKNIIEDKDRA